MYEYIQSEATESFLYKTSGPHPIPRRGYLPVQLLVGTGMGMGIGMGARMDRRSRRLCGAGNSTNDDDGTYSWDLMGFGKSIDSGEARPGWWNSQR